MFFALLFAIIETAIMFFAGQVLETITLNDTAYTRPRLFSCLTYPTNSALPVITNSPSCPTTWRRVGAIRKPRNSKRPRSKRGLF
jgi:hypothetical protein